MKQQIVAFLTLFLLVTPVWAGTFRDDFEDGDWRGWRIQAGVSVKTSDVADRFSIVDGILRMDALNKPQQQLNLYVMRDWKDYRFSADIRIIDVEPGAP